MLLILIVIVMVIVIIVLVVIDINCYFLLNCYCFRLLSKEPLEAPKKAKVIVIVSKSYSYCNSY